VRSRAEHTAQHVRPTLWHQRFGKSADDIASESGGIRRRAGSPKRERGGQDDVAGAEPLCARPYALDPVVPQTTRCSTGVPVRTLPPVCSTVAAGGRSTRRSWRRSRPDAQPGQALQSPVSSPPGTSASSARRLRHEVMGATCCASVLPGAVACTPALRAALAATSLYRLPGSPLGGACGGVADTHDHPA
jgi:hypothetical protein